MARSRHPVTNTSAHEHCTILLHHVRHLRSHLNTTNQKHIPKPGTLRALRADGWRAFLLARTRKDGRADPLGDGLRPPIYHQLYCYLRDRAQLQGRGELARRAPQGARWSVLRPGSNGKAP